MDKKTAMVTGGLRGLGRAMAFALAKSGYNVTAIGHIASDVEEMERTARADGCAERMLCVASDLRRPGDCDSVVEATRTRFATPDILINSAALTYTYIWPDRYQRSVPHKPWDATDTIVQTVMDTNYVAADQMARRLAPGMVEKGWGRIINVTTNLATMNELDSSAYGASKAALEMATESWAKALSGTRVTANILNPGGGANTAGIAQELRERSRRGEIPPLVQPEDMVAPLMWLVSREADDVNGFRFDAKTWDKSLAAAAAARANGVRAGLVTYPADDPANRLA